VATNVKTFTSLVATKDSVLQNTLPSFITFTPNTTLSSNGHKITLANITKAHLGTWSLALTETNGFGTTPITTTALTIIVNCAITSISDIALTTDSFDANREITYTLYSGTK